MGEEEDLNSRYVHFQLGSSVKLWLWSESGMWSGMSSRGEDLITGCFMKKKKNL